MKRGYSVYNKNFRDLHKKHKRPVGEDMFESIDLLLCNSSYNERQQQNLIKINRDVFNAKKTIAFCKFVGNG